MSSDDLLPEADSWRSAFPAFGGGGDLIGARRARHAFRWTVACCVVLVLILWVSERFVRYEHAEMLYVAAITKPDEQARVFLRQAVAHDDENRDLPTPKYLHALAAREEDDAVLDTYQRAFQADPGNAALAVRYGCRLFFSGDARAAHARFREASDNASNNALPAYLEAAVLPWVEEDEDEENTDQKETDNLTQALALIARTNSSSKQVDFPRPLWSADLPQSGAQYAHLCRRLVSECAGPFYRFTDHLIAQAQSEPARERARNWPSWLEHIERMGDRIAAGALPKGESDDANPVAGAAVQAYVGLYIKLAAIRQSEQIRKRDLGRPDEERLKQQIKIEEALGELQDFENNRDKRIADDTRRYIFPNRLCAWTLAIFALCHLLGFLISKGVGARGPCSTIAHTRVGKSAMIAGAGLFFVLLLGITILQRVSNESPGWVPVIQTAWWIVVVVCIWFGPAYPILTLPSAREACPAGPGGHVDKQVLRAARKGRRAAWVALMRRFYGVQFGLTLSAVCLWVVVYRICVSLYPWQIRLLATGLAAEETELVRQVLETILL